MFSVGWRYLGEAQRRRPRFLDVVEHERATTSGAFGSVRVYGQGRQAGGGGQLLRDNGGSLHRPLARGNPRLYSVGAIKSWSSVKCIAYNVPPLSARKIVLGCDACCVRLLRLPI